MKRSKKGSGRSFSRKKLPKTLKVGAITYKLLNSEDHEIDGNLGCSHHDLKIIKINKNLADGAMQITLLHEALHCINGQLDEELIEWLSNSLYLLFKDNKKLKDILF